MRTRWPKRATARQRAATDELLRRLHTKYPHRMLSSVLFGSVARGDFTSESDIDVLVVADRVDTDFKWDVWGIGAEVSLEFDVIFNLRVYSGARWQWMRENRRTLWRNVEKDGIELKLQTKERARAAVG